MRWMVYLWRVFEHWFREHIKYRHPHWAEFEQDFLLRYPSCAACGSTKRVVVHHIENYEYEPSKEVDFSNCITLCCSHLQCHRLIGHGGSWRFRNPYVRSDAETVLKQPALRPLIEEAAREKRLFQGSH